MVEAVKSEPMNKSSPVAVQLSVVFLVLTVNSVLFESESTCRYPPPSFDRRFT